MKSWYFLIFIFFVMSGCADTQSLEQKIKKNEKSIERLEQKVENQSKVTGEIKDSLEGLNEQIKVSYENIVDFKRAFAERLKDREAARDEQAKAFKERIKQHEMFVKKLEHAMGGLHNSINDMRSMIQRLQKTILMLRNMLLEPEEGDVDDVPTPPKGEK